MPLPAGCRRLSFESCVVKVENKQHNPLPAHSSAVKLPSLRACVRLFPLPQETTPHGKAGYIQLYSGYSDCIPHLESFLE